MSNLIPPGLKKRFKQGFYEYLKVMGKKITAVLNPYSVDCPNCVFDSVHQKSSNIYDSNFVRPLRIFVNTPAEKIIYPQPFNVASISGIQFDPSISEPKSLNTSVCPTCKGNGILTSPNEQSVHCLVTWSPSVSDNTLVEFTAGLDPKNICRIKSYSSNYAVCRDAEYFLIDGTKCTHITSPRLKGLGAEHIVEEYLIASEVTRSISDKFDGDTRLHVGTIGQTSDQASPVTPTIPPVKPGDDVW